MSRMLSFRRQTFEAPCTIAIEHSADSLHAHVELVDGFEIRPGASGRIVLKAGIALPVFFNIPFAEIAAADVQVHADGTADIAFRLTPGQRIAYLHLWPHAKPLVFKEPQPMLRCIPNGARVAERLRAALEMFPVAAARPSAAAGESLVAA